MTKSKLTGQKLLEVFNDIGNLNFLKENEKFKEIKERIVKSFNEELEKKML